MAVAAPRSAAGGGVTAGTTVAIDGAGDDRFDGMALEPTEDACPTLAPSACSIDPVGAQRAGTTVMGRAGTGGAVRAAAGRHHSWGQAWVVMTT